MSFSPRIKAWGILHGNSGLFAVGCNPFALESFCFLFRRSLIFSFNKMRSVALRKARHRHKNSDGRTQWAPKRCISVLSWRQTRPPEWICPRHPTSVTSPSLLTVLAEHFAVMHYKKSLTLVPIPRGEGGSNVMPQRFRPTELCEGSGMTHPLVPSQEGNGTRAYEDVRRAQNQEKPTRRFALRGHEVISRFSRADGPVQRQGLG
jgi:hypothetical protein